MANGNFAGGDGSELAPFLIEDAHDLDAIRNGLDKHYKLINDIDLDISPYNEGEGWIPIVNFRGVLDGDNFKILNLFISSSSTSSKGFMYSLDYNGIVIKNIQIYGSVIALNNSNGIGILAGGIISNLNSITVENVHVYGNVEGRSSVGGLMGYCFSNAKISNCSSDVIVTNKNTSGSSSANHLGCLIGQLTNGAKIINCRSFGKIVSIGNNVGGLVGTLHGTNSEIVNSYSTSTVEGQQYIGGLVGALQNNAKTKKSFSIGSVIGISYVGGLVGLNQSTQPESSFWDMETSGNSTSAGGTGLATAEMQTAQTFIDAGWDFELNEDGTPVWILKDGKYPKLWFEVEKYSLININNKYFTYKNNEFIEVEPTIENFELYNVDLSELTTPTNKVGLTMGEGVLISEGREFRKLINMTEFRNKYGEIKGINGI